MDRQEATKFMLDCLRTMLLRKGSDLFISADFPPACKIDGRMTPLSDRALSSAQTSVLVRAIMNDRQVRDYEAHKECNFAINPQGIGRFRVNAFIQQGLSGAVLRTITSTIPELDDLGLPSILKDLIMTKRGLILVVGGTGSGKSTSLAAMIGHRNQNSHGHIITIEDPVEYVHPHRNCLITQREVGVDTESWDAALMNTLRQAPDVILIGEIRARETMEHAINFAETGHLCLSTLHANSANQALDRIINLFPEERRVQLLMDLSLNLRAIISQRLLPCTSGGRIAAIEILINSPLIQDLIFKGDVHGIKGVMKKSREQGMQTFDMALFALYEAGKISYEDAMRSADSMNELRLAIKLEGHEAQGKDFFSDADGFSIAAEGEEEGGGDSVLFGAPQGGPKGGIGSIPFGRSGPTGSLALESDKPAAFNRPGVGQGKTG
ncbi:PilT/PilU family type 4a pilus ATPase [uncultured Thiodictyon sp.]|uniref:PilT/PilU family type 4a pilus ATPase n=1 Tax=uncultured Thiodictyon sp. TaxID=1846217 RepID=UPI0025F54BE8|nr:PilT/PilU family type 4a pilus ATPase [uncultured Thiodictyon sp.]